MEWSIQLLNNKNNRIHKQQQITPNSDIFRDRILLNRAILIGSKQKENKADTIMIVSMMRY